MVSILRGDDGKFIALMAIIDGTAMSFKEWDKALAIWNLISKEELTKDLEVL